MSKFNCKHCNAEFDNNKKLTGHSTWCKQNPNLSKNLNRLAEVRPSTNGEENYLKANVKAKCKWCEIELETTRSKYNNHVRWCDKNPISEEEKFSCLRKARAARTEESVLKMKWSIKEAHKRGAYDKANQNKKGKPAIKMTPKVRKKLSEKRKEWLSANPDKHPWKNNEKYISAPCEHLKSILAANGIDFKPEDNPVKGRAFAVDIAFPELKLGIEVNGNQHYKKDGSLKKYYQDRHDLIVASGWNLLELHYKKCYQADVLDIVKNFLGGKK